MLYPEPLPLRLDAASISALRANTRDHFGIDLPDDGICRVSGRMVAGDPHHRHVLSLQSDTEEHRMRIRSQTVGDAGVVSKTPTLDGQDYLQLELEGEPFLLTCVGVAALSENSEDPQAKVAFAAHIGLRHRCSPAADKNRSLATEILSDGMLRGIAEYADKPAWSADVLSHLAQSISQTISGLAVVDCHGDCHLGNFVMGKNGSGGLLPSHFQGAYPHGFDLATALWSMLQTESKADTLAFCRMVARQTVIERQIAAALSDLIVLRCLWWLGLRMAWRDHVPFESRSMIERHLEFAMNVRVLQHQFQNAFSMTKGGPAHER